MKIAKKDDWKVKEMPKKNKVFNMDINLDEEEFCILKNGHIPKEMEDKWFAYFENDMLYIHRSWTGICIYIIKFSSSRKIDNVIVNRDKDEYKETSIKGDKINLSILIDNLIGRSHTEKLQRAFEQDIAKKSRELTKVSIKDRLLSFIK